MRRVHLVVGAVVVVLAMLVVWRLRCHGDAGADGSDESGSSTSAAHGGQHGRNGKAAAPASLSGRVVRTSDGAGIGGAVVSVAKASLGEMFAHDQEPTTIATTDATGAFTIPAIAPGTYTVAAVAAGFVPAMKDKLVVAAGAHAAVDLALAAGGTVVGGTVSDVGGGPIGGARVTMTREGMIFEGRGELVTLTNAEGKYEMTLADGSYFAVATHEDYTTQHHNFELLGERLTIDFTMSPGGQIRGQVVTRDGKPVPGAIVSTHGGRRRWGSAHPTAADDAGNFTIKGLDSGAIKLSAVAAGYRSMAPVIVELGIGEQTDGVRLVLDHALAIRGRVVRAGKPTEGIPGIQLGVFSMADGANAMAMAPSDDTGAFEIIGVKPGNYMAFAIGEGVMPEIGKPVTVADKDVDDLVIEMATGVTLSGRVDPPVVAGMRLELAKDKVGIGNMFQAVKAMMVRAESDERGAFTLRNVPPGEYAVVASTTDGRKGKLAVTVADADQQGLVVPLEARAAFAGRVVDANGSPVAGVHVQVKPALAEKLGMTVSFDDVGGGDGDALTGVNGNFRAVGLDAGKVHVSVTDDQGRIPWAKGDRREQPLEYELVKGQEMANVTLTVEARDGVIRGIVVGADHKPVADAWVTPRLQHTGPKDKTDFMVEFRGDRQPVLTNADGKFTIDRLRRGTYELAVEGPRGASRGEKQDVKPGDSVTIELSALGSVAGHVTASGKPVTEFDLACHPKAPEKRFEVDYDDVGGRHFQNAEGSYTVERLAPGEYTCATTATAGTATGSATVASGPAKLDLALVPWATVTGVVVSALDGKPVPGLFALATGETVNESSMLEMFTGKAPTTDASGRFVAERVSSGKGKLQIVPKDSSFNHLAEREFTATPGQRVDLGTIKVIPPRTGDAGTFGITAANDDGKLIVASVMPDGPADRAGVKAGDRIVSIDNQPIPELGVEIALQLLFNGTAMIGQKLVLGLERDGKPVPPVTVVAVKW